MGYFLYIIGTMVIFPVGFIIYEFYVKKKNTSLVETIGKWFIFWAIGIRLFTAGISQIFNPAFTANILGVDSPSHVLIQELGFANLLFGILGTSSIFFPKHRFPASSGGVFLGMAGLLHVTRISEDISFKESIALVSDLFIFTVVIFYYLNLILNRKLDVKSTEN